LAYVLLKIKRRLSSITSDPPISSKSFTTGFICT